MRIGLVSYFDLGCSYGLTDDTFQEELRNPETAIGLVGIRNPLGEGTTLGLTSVAPDVIALWRREAVAQVRRPEMETGWNDTWNDLSRADFDVRLAELVEKHPISVCDLTVYALGTVYFRFELGPGVDLRFLQGVLACFEYAAYRPAVSRALLDQARAHARRALASSRNEFTRLTSRPTAEIQKDAEGYEESNLFTAFTHLVRCIDGGDEKDLEPLLASLEMAKAPVIDFEYHGLVHYTWSTCVLQPRGQQPWTSEQDLARIMECVRIAHVFLGTCEAFLRLFHDEINMQVDSYVTQQHAGRGPQELNRLRTLALAVVSLTNFGRVTQSDEDQDYFRRFAEDAGLAQTHELLTNAVDVLYNVQDAEAQDARSRREYVLNTVVVLLASLTLISVTADAYNFIGDQEPLIAERLQRALLLTEFILAVTLLVGVLLWYLSRPPRRRRNR